MVVCACPVSSVALAQRQNRIAPLEAARRHDRLACRQNVGRRAIGVGSGEEVARAALVRLQIADERRVG